MAAFDKSKIKAIPIQKTLVLINNFIVNTSSFLNAFSNTVEKKIAQASNKITNLETLLSVLEAKLNSIPDLNVNEPATVNQKSHVSSESTTTSSIPNSLGTHVVETIQHGIDENNQQMISISQHPDYIPFIKLLKVGVPLVVVQAKVAASGLNPDLITNPDLLIDI